MLRKWFSAPEEEIAPEATPARNGSPDPMREQGSQREEAAARQSGPPAPVQPQSPPGRYSSFEQIYQSVTNKLPRIPYNILKVAEMMHSSHLNAMSTDAKRCSLLMALEAAG